MVLAKCRVAVDVATGWTAPGAPRAIDAAAVADHPDITAWLAELDASGSAGRLELHGRTLTQFVRGEPVDVIDEAAEWVRVVSPWQPSPLDPRGYPAWVRRSHLARRIDDAAPPDDDGVAGDAWSICVAARAHLGLRYLWGGTTSYGLDCSGLVHHSYRRAGIVVPRDAHAQHAVATPVGLDEERPGDLYFFARDDGAVFHVGFVTGHRSMLHAPETGKGIEETGLSPGRLESLFAVGRLVG